MPQTPSIGRVVHYVAYGTPGGEYRAGAHRAAVITEALHLHAEGDDERLRVGLCILNPTGLFFTKDVPFDAKGEKPGTWHWPEYVP